MILKPHHLKPMLITAAILMVAVLLWVSFQKNSNTPTFYKNPYDSVQLFMEGIYAADHKIEPIDYKIRALIVPHHLTATESIASGIRMLQHQKFSKILLISPDHFDQCPTIGCTVNSDYETFFGNVKASGETIRSLTKTSFISIQKKLFEKEHGIYAVLPYIAHYFPKVSVTPLVLSQHLPWKSHADKLLQAIESQMDSETMLIVSSDFSHYLPLGKADEMDEMTAKTLFSKNLEGVASLKNPSQSDCPNCLWVLGSLAAKEDFYNPSIVLHTNSARILKDDKITSTTSHFSIIWTQNSQLSPEDMAIGGDVTLTRATKLPTLPKTIQDWWAGTGLRLVNLEGPLGEKCTPESNPYLFCNPESLWLNLKDLATHWGIMNNHLLDRGVEGLEETKNILASAGETAVGEIPHEDKNVRIFALTALINSVKDTDKLDIQKNYQAVLKGLKNHQDDKMNVVFVHYGTEYQALISDQEKKFLETFIDAGADVVIGDHSHVVSDMHFYKGKPIFHGLGNFIFDQSGSVATSTSELVRLRKRNKNIIFQTLISDIKMHQKLSSMIF